VLTIQMVQMTARSAVSEDGKVGERSNNNVTLDDRHGSQVTDGTNIENVHTGLQ